MKRIFMFVILVMMLGCCPKGNQGYGYETKSSPEKSFLERTVENQSTKRMNLYDTKGKLRNSCAAYKGEFDGHTWYVFFDNVAVPAVVHDPLCKCQKDGSNKQLYN